MKVLPAPHPYYVGPGRVYSFRILECGVSLYLQM